MAKKRSNPTSWVSFFLLLSLLLLLSLSSTSSSSPSSHFEGFGDELDELEEDPPIQLTDLPLTQSEFQQPDQTTTTPQQENPTKPKSQFEYWDEDEFEGLPLLPHQDEQNPDSNPPSEPTKITQDAIHDDPDENPTDPPPKTPFKISSFTVEISCLTFLIMFAVNYFTGKRENENIALAWAARFATKDSIFDKNFSLLGVGDGDDSPLLLKEGQNVFKFYASGRRYCQGLLATMELKSRHDLISRLYNAVVPCRDEISFEVYMNDEAMDQVVFAVAKRKLAKGMVKEVPDLQKFGAVVGTPSGRKWVAEELAVVSESKEVAGDLITEAVLDQVFGDKAFEKFGKLFISMHFSDQQPGIHRKKLMFKFALPDANHMADMTRLVALVPYYIDLIGRYKLSSQARSKTDGARVKAAQEAYKELQNARQEALQRKKAERKKMMEEAEAKLSAEAIRKREAKERARQMKKAMPKMKMTRGH